MARRKIELDLSTATVWPSVELLRERDPVTGLKLIEVLVSFKVRFRIDGRLVELEVLKGFKYDGASLPWGIRNFWDPLDPLTLLGATIHDPLYSSKGGTRDIPGFPESGLEAGVILTKDECDYLLYLFIRANGTSWLRSELYFIAVQRFGKTAWDDDN